MGQALLAMLTAALLTLAAADRSTAFPPGWNGLAQAPPLGWRSWNAFGNRITQALMEQQLEALTAKNRSVPGRAEKVSLAELGYGSFGIDEGWEACGQGVNRTQHAADGKPVVEKAFPDLSALVASGHKQGLRMGWYSVLFIRKFSTVGWWVLISIPASLPTPRYGHCELCPQPHQDKRTRVFCISVSALKPQ